MKLICTWKTLLCEKISFERQELIQRRKEGFCEWRKSFQTKLQTQKRSLYTINPIRFPAWTRAMDMGFQKQKPLKESLNENILKFRRKAKLAFLLNSLFPYYSSFFAQTYSELIHIFHRVIHKIQGIIP
jgi:hypothetical protein